VVSSSDVPAAAWYRSVVARSAPAPAPAETPETSETAARILQAAVSVFSRYGFRRASVDDVAREAGVAKGTIYLYHESKEAMFRAVGQAVADRLLLGAAAARAAEGPTPERLRLVLEAKFLYLYDVVTRSPHAAELLDSKGRLLADLFEAVDRKYQAHVAAVVADGVASGELDLTRAGLTPSAAAAFLVRAGHGLETADAGGLPSRDVYRKRIAELVRVALAGLGHRA
jgi:AcrR family transcriptional regulator